MTTTAWRAAAATFSTELSVGNVAFGIDLSGLGVSSARKPATLSSKRHGRMNVAERGMKELRRLQVRVWHAFAAWTRPNTARGLGGPRKHGARHHRGLVQKRGRGLPFILRTALLKCYGLSRFRATIPAGRGLHGNAGRSIDVGAAAASGRRSRPGDAHLSPDPAGRSRPGGRPLPPRRRVVGTRRARRGRVVLAANAAATAGPRRRPQYAGRRARQATEA